MASNRYASKLLLIMDLKGTLCHLAKDAKITNQAGIYSKSQSGVRSVKPMFYDKDY